MFQKIKKIVRKIQKETLTLLQPKKNPYTINIDENKVSDGAYKAAENIRGKHQPSLMIYGVTTRSGTNYIANLLALHQDIVASPNQVWEVPFLRHINHIMDFEDAYFRFENLSKNMKKHDFLALFGASFLSYLHSFVSPEKKMLVKEPNANYLFYFPIVFPNEELILVLRDGRDVVYSTLKSWPERDFKEVCQRWNDNARLMLQFYSKHKGNSAYMFVKYEDVVADPEKFITRVCEIYSLDLSKFQLGKVESMPVVGSSVASQDDGKVNWKNVDRPSDFNPVGRWQSWSAKEKRIFKQIAGQTLFDAGYCEDLNW